MRVEINEVAKVESFEDFCDRHELWVKIEERQGVRGPMRYYASLMPHVEIKCPGTLLSTFNNGNTPEEALAGLPAKFTGKRLVVGAYTKERIEFNAPNEWLENNGKST